MRVIAGKARSLHLKTIEGLDTRPTTDRIKETLFNMINDELYGASFLDLFSGSGGIGIEALSRGARKAVFVESSLHPGKFKVHPAGLRRGSPCHGRFPSAGSAGCSGRELFCDFYGSAL